MSRILITGISGFIGGFLYEALRGPETYGLMRHTSMRYPTDPNIIPGDIVDGDVYRVVQEISPDIVLHLAAVSSNERALAFPVQAMRVNTVGTARMTQACKSVPNLKAFIQASSSEVCGAQDGLRNPYIASKIAAEEVVKSSGLPYVIMRPFNTYGRGPIGLPRFVVDEAIYSGLTRSEVYLRDPEPRRDFLFRDDHVNAYLAVVAAIGVDDRVLGQTLQFGTGQVFSIRELAEMIAIRTNSSVGFGEGKRTGDVPLLQADNSKAEELLDWRVEYLFEEGLTQAISEWEAWLYAHDVAGKAAAAV